MVEITLSEDQEFAVREIHKFINARGRELTMGGLAGTGKTYIIARALTLPNRPPVAFVALSGKAASVLKSKLERAGALLAEDYVGTIHGLIYETDKVKQSGILQVISKKEDEVVERQPMTEKTHQKIDWRFNDMVGYYGLIVVDEASMVNGDIHRDLLKLNIPILAVGDHGQLPPIGGDFNWMENPMIKLEHIHRQAADNPIVRMAMQARLEGKINMGVWGPGVEMRQMTGDRSFASEVTRDTMMLCGRNDTRIWWNNKLREQFGFSGHDPMVGERVVCLKNNHEKKIYNGMLGEILAIQPSGRHWYNLQVKMESGLIYQGKCLKHQFGSVSNLYNFSDNGRPMSRFEIEDLFDWGWCITVHKAQGSEWDSVVLLKERISRSEDEWRRWLYTGSTRAREKLLVVGS